MAHRPTSSTSCRARPGGATCSTAPLRFPHLLRYRRLDAPALYDELRMPQRLQAVLAGQAGDYLLPPGAGVAAPARRAGRGYDRGAYYPEKHFPHFIDRIAQWIAAQPGCRIMLEHEVDRIVVENGPRRRRADQDRRASSRRAATSRTSIPARTAALVGREHVAADLPATRSDYAYSCSTFTHLSRRARARSPRARLRLVQRVALPARRHQPIYGDQLERHDLTNPWLFLATPTLHSDAPGLAPPVTRCSRWRRAATTRFSKRCAPRIAARTTARRRGCGTRCSTCSRRATPRLRRHLAIHVAGTPTTNADSAALLGETLTARRSLRLTRAGPASPSTPRSQSVPGQRDGRLSEHRGTVASGIRLYDHLALGGRSGA